MRRKEMRHLTLKD